MSQERVIKTIQSFKRNKKSAHMGDRVAILVQSIKNETIERCYVIKGKCLQITEAFLANIRFYEHYKFSAKTKGKFHISISHLNIMATMYFFVVD